MSIRYHYNLIYDDLQATLESFSWSSVQTRMAFKTALSCMTAIFLANCLRLDYPFWSGITALVIMRPNVGAVFQRGWMRSVGCGIGCMICIFFMGYIVQSPLSFSIFLFCGVFLSFYLGVQVKYGYFWSYMLANMALIAMISVANPYGTFPLHIAFVRGAEILLGVIVAWFYNIILWPRYAGDELANITSELIYKITLYIKETTEQYYSGEYNTDKVSKMLKETHILLKKAHMLTSSAENEKGLTDNDYQKYVRVINSLKGRIDHLEMSYNTFYKFGKSEFVIKHQDSFKIVIDELNNILKHKNDNRNSQINSFEKVKNSLNKIEEKKNIDLKEVIQQYSVREIMLFYEFVYSIESYCNAVIQNLVKNTDLQNKPKLTHEYTKDIDSDFIDFKYSSKSFSIYLPAFKNAVKGGLAIVFTFWICLWLHIPGGYTNMAIAIIAVFAPQMDNMTTKHKGVLRFFGCLSGATVGLLFLMLNINSGFILFIIIFAVIFFYCIIWSGKPGIAYLGLQGGIAFLLCVAVDFLPATSIDGVIERMTGIFLAVSMMWFFHFILWPDNLVLKLKNKVIDLRKSMEVYLNSNYFFSAKNRMAGEYSKALNIFKVNIESTLKVLEIQQDLPIETIQQINNWAHYIEKISNKLTALDSIDRGVYVFALEYSPKFLNHISFIIHSAINLKTDRDKEKVLLVLNKQSNTIDQILSSLRETGLISKKSTKFKKEFVAFIILLRHIIDDLKHISEYRINLEKLSIQ